jgi:Ca2+-transporting ATPase
MLAPAVATVLAIELPFLQRILDTTSLTGGQWQVVVLLSLVVPIVIEITKAVRRSRQ